MQAAVDNALEYQELPVNQNNGNDGGAHVDSTNDGSVEQGSVGTVAQHIKQLSGVEHDGVDAGKLLEEGNQDGPSLQTTTNCSESKELCHMQK